MSPESLLLLHHVAHAELLAELRAGWPAGSRGVRRAANAVTRALAVRGAVRRRAGLAGGGPAMLAGGLPGVCIACA